MSGHERKIGVREALRRWDWLLVVAIAPLLLFPAVSRAWALVAIPVVLGVQWWVWGTVLPLTPLNPALLMLAVMVGVSIFVTPDPAGSLGKIAGVLLGMLVFFTVARHSRHRQGWKGAMALFSMTGIGVALVGLAGTNWFTTKITILNALTARLPIRLSGLAGAEMGIHPNELAGALLWVVPVVLMAGVALMVDAKWFASRSGRGKVRGRSLAGWIILLGTGILVCLGVLVLSQSRGGYLAIAISGLALLVLIARGKARWVMIIFAVAVVVAGVVVVDQMGWQQELDQATVRLPEGGSAFSLNSLASRVEIWSRAVWAIQDVPLTGLGMNVFRKAIYLLYPTYEVTAGFDLGHAHNEMLQAALDLGLPGLVGFLAVYIGAVGMLTSSIRGSGVWRLLALGILGGLLAHFMYGITDAVALGGKPGFLFWWLLGMTCGLYEQNLPGKAAKQ